MSDKQLLVTDILDNLRGESMRDHTAWLWDLYIDADTEIVKRAAKEYLTTKGQANLTKRVIKALDNPNPREPGWENTLVDSGLITETMWYDITRIAVKPALTKMEFSELMKVYEVNEWEPPV